MTTYKVVMVRHGESEWNQANKFCGWFDADLSELGVKEAKSSGKVRTAQTLSVGYTHLYRN